MLPFACLAGGSLWEKIVIWYQNSLLCELLTYLEERYFTVDFGAYENIPLGADADKKAQSIILMLALGIIIAAGMIAYTRNHLGRFVKSLLAKELFAPERAQTLTELGFFRDSAIRRELSRGVNLRRVVRCREEEEHDCALEAKKKEYDADESPEKAPFVALPFQMDFTTAHFYIPEDLRYRAEFRYRKKGSGWGIFLGIVLATILAAGLVCFLLPDLFRFSDNLISMLSPS